MKLFFIILLVLFNKVQAQPLYQNSVTNTGSGSPASVNAPTGISNGDLLVVGFMFEKGSAETINPPAGWTLILRTNNSTDCGMATYFKVAGASEPASYSFSVNNGSKWCLGISRITDAETSTPVYAFGGSTGGSGNPVAPSVATTGNNGLILCYYTNKKNATYTPAAGTTERYDAPNMSEGLPSNMMASFTLSSSGATSNTQAIVSETEKWAAQQIAIRPLTVVPITLLYFGANVCDVSSVCLNWQTASESSNDYFIIERSHNGTDWTNIAKVNGSGNSSTILSYNYIDKNTFSGISYYRLKQTDFDRRFSFSPIKAVSLKIQKNKKLNIYPNPTENHFIVNGVEDEISGIQIFNLLGQNITAQVKISKINDDERIIDISGLSRGMYYIKTENAVSEIIRK